MSTETLTPSNQRSFSSDFAANYPGRTEDVIGQVVGPNWLREFLVARDANYSSLTDETRVDFELLTEDRKGLLTAEARREFTTRVSNDKLDRDADGLCRLPEWSELNEADRYFKLPHLWM